jgi:hypothetical protein
MFRSSADHHQGVYLFLVKNHLIKIRVFIRGDVVMRQHNMHLFYVVSGVERYADSVCIPLQTRHHVKQMHVMLPHYHITTYEESNFN